MRLYLVRHGQRDFGEHFDRLLTAGIWQAKQIGPWFKDKRITKVYCSPQNRARKTLKEILPYLRKGIKVSISNRIRQKSSPEEIGKSAMLLYNMKKDSSGDVAKRVKSFINILKKNNPNDNILVVGHKEVTREFVRQIVEKYRKYDNEDISIRNASVSYFDFDKEGKLKNYNVGRVVYSKKKNRLFRNAFLFAREKHKGQNFDGTEDKYILHPAYVGRLLAIWGRDVDVIVAGYLHDIIEDCDVKLSEIRSKFGKKVAFYVDGMSWERKWNKKERAYRKDWEGYHKKFCKYAIKDSDLVLIKAADEWSKPKTSKNVKHAIKFAPRAKSFWIPFFKEVGLKNVANLIETKVNMFDKKRYDSKLNDYISKKALTKIRKELVKINGIEKLY